MNAFITTTQATSLTDVDLSGFSVKQITALATYTEGVSVIDSELREWVKKRGTWTSADQSFCLTMVARKKAGVMFLPGGYEEMAWSKGGAVSYSPTKVTITVPAAEKVEIKSTPIPLQGLPVRAHDQQLIGLLCSIFDIKSGVLTTIASQDTWTRYFNFEGSTVDPVGVVKIKEVFDSVLKSHTRYESITASFETLQGNRFFQFCGEAIAHCKYVDYLAMHTAVCLHFFKAYTLETRGNRMIPVVRNCQIKDQKREPLIALSSIDFVKSATFTGPQGKAAHKQFVDSVGHDPIMLKGPIGKRIRFYDTTSPSYEKANKSVTEGMAFRGGSGRGMGKLTSCLGFGTLQSAQTRKLIQMIAIAVPLLESGIQVDLQACPGDVPGLVFAFIEKRKIRPEMFRMVVDPATILKVSTKYREYCSCSTRDGAHYVRVSGEKPPSLKAAKNADEQALEFQDSILKGLPKDFTIFAPVVSASVFTKGYGVYELFPSQDFTMCITTQHKLMVFRGTKNVEEKKTISEVRDVWISVLKNNWRTCTYFMSPEPFYNDWANNPVGPTGGITISYDSNDDWELFIPPEPANYGDDDGNERNSVGYSIVDTMGRVATPPLQVTPPGSGTVSPNVVAPGTSTPTGSKKQQKQQQRQQQYQAKTQAQSATGTATTTITTPAVAQSTLATATTTTTTTTSTVVAPVAAVTNTAALNSPNVPSSGTAVFPADTDGMDIISD